MAYLYASSVGQKQNSTLSKEQLASCIFVNFFHTEFLTSFEQYILSGNTS